MTEKDNQPRPYDLVLGGNNPPHTDGLVLGGIEGLKLQFQNANSNEKKIAIIKKALLHGQATKSDKKINFQKIIFENLNNDLFGQYRHITLTILL